MKTARDVTIAMQALATLEKAAASVRFFKSGPGQYGEGDKFLGITVPEIRRITKNYMDLPLHEIELLLRSQWHEERLAALIILNTQFIKAHKKADEINEKNIYGFYLAHTKYINSWDLVDSSAEYIVGPYLENKAEKLPVLEKLANSSLLWERRIAVLATFDYIKKGAAEEALIICTKLLYDEQDLIQKAVGWMLREIGKRVDRQILKQFLDQHAGTMPRTTLRYAIEHFDPKIRQQYLMQKGTL